MKCLICRLPRPAGVTPAARIAAAIDLLEVIEGAPKRPADAVANDFFRSRRYIGSGDRRAVSDRVWTVLRTRRRLGWWLGEAAQSARLLVAASLLLEGWGKAGVAQAFSGGQFAPRRCRVPKTASCRASPATRLTIPPCRTPCGWKFRTGCCRVWRRASAPA